MIRPGAVGLAGSASVINGDDCVEIAVSGYNPSRGANVTAFHFQSLKGSIDKDAAFRRVRELQPVGGGRQAEARLPVRAKKVTPAGKGRRLCVVSLASGVSTSGKFGVFCRCPAGSPE